MRSQSCQECINFSQENIIIWGECQTILCRQYRILWNKEFQWRSIKYLCSFNWNPLRSRHKEGFKYASILLMEMSMQGRLGRELRRTDIPWCKCDLEWREREGGSLGGCVVDCRAVYVSAKPSTSLQDKHGCAGSPASPRNGSALVSLPNSVTDWGKVGFDAKTAMMTKVQWLSQSCLLVGHLRAFSWLLCIFYTQGIFSEEHTGMTGRHQPWRDVGHSWRQKE